MIIILPITIINIIDNNNHSTRNLFDRNSKIFLDVTILWRFEKILET